VQAPPEVDLGALDEGEVADAEAFEHGVLSSRGRLGRGRWDSFDWGGDWGKQTVRGRHGDHHASRVRTPKKVH
jgi:hypothetical protein